jgi:O-antigen biosynthesis protein
MPKVPPKVSVFTPSHDTRWLEECLESLLAQTFTDWEWVVLLNQGAEWRTVPDRRVRVRTASKNTVKGVGAAKRTACAFAHGEILVELDHDDLLEPDALEAIVEVFDGSPNIGFVYSDWCNITQNGKRDDSRWDNGGDWEYYEHDGLLATRSFEPFPHNVSTMVFAPNHVRAFRKSVYDDVGGYDKTRVIADDLDLIARMYRATEFHHIARPLYRQRIHNAMTQRDQPTNDAIQAESLLLYDNNVEPNAIAWANWRFLTCLDLGGAHNSPNGYKVVDLAPCPPERKPNPGWYQGDALKILSHLKESSVGVIRAVDFLEHVEDKIALFNEMYRVLAHGGMLISITPSTDGRGAFQDPTHVSYYNENSFWYYTDRDFAQYVPEITCRFQVSRLVTYFPSGWHREHDIPYVSCNLVAIKDGPKMGGRLAI